MTEGRLQNDISVRCYYISWLFQMPSTGKNARIIVNEPCSSMMKILTSCLMWVKQAGRGLVKILKTFVLPVLMVIILLIFKYL